MNELAQFHWLRPLWLLAMLPAVVLAIAWWLQPGSGANWRRSIAPELLDHLLESSTEQRRQWPWLVLAGWLLAALALAGPTWEKLPQPVLQKRDALVMVLDLSLSMYAEDVQPSRLQRARFKILDILQRRQEGLTGLVVYSGDAHVVSPLTDDTATIANLVPALAPDMMPVHGSDPVAGIEQALQLLRNAGFERGRILLLSDDIADANIAAIAQRLDPAHWQLSILGVGTVQGAPIPIAAKPQSARSGNGTAVAGGFLKQSDGQIVVAQLHRERFEQLASRTQGRYSDLRADDRDIDALLPDTMPRESETRSVQREFDRWRERGPWLAIALLPLAALAFRRGWLLMLVLLPLALPAPATAADTAPAPANTAQSLWRNLWQRPDQQAAQALQDGDAQSAATQFRDPAWRAAALYRAGDYEAAAQALQDLSGFDADYNRGNALARAGHLQESLAAYDAALQKSPDSDDAKANRALVEKLLQQQKQQQSNQQQNQQQQGQSSQGDGSQQQSPQQSQQQQQDEQGQQDPNQQSQNQDGQGQQNDAASAQGNAGKEQKSSADAAAQDAKDNADNTRHDAKKAQADGADSSASQAAAEQAAQEQQSAQTASAGEKHPEHAPQNAAAPGDEAQQQRERATEQWLRQVPDDPSGLLRRKFLYEHRQRERAAPARDEQPQW